jgi:hypothetical protein
LIISSDTEPTALHLRSDERHNSYITNRNNFVENNTTENNDLIISSANRLVLQTGNRDQNHGHDQLVVLTNRIDMIGTKISGNAGVLAVEGRDHVYLEFFPLGFDESKERRNRRGWLGYPDKGINDLCVMNENNANLKLGTNKTDILTINKVGHVGIGTTEPEHRLHVHGNVRFENPGLTGSSLHFEAHDGFHRIVFDHLKLYDNQAGDTVTINDGNVGVGNTEPKHRLHVYGNTRLENPLLSGSSLQFEPHKGFHRIVFDHLKLYDNQAGDTVTINDGLVGVGTSNPQARLHVSGDLKVEGGIFINNERPIVIKNYKAVSPSVKDGFFFLTINDDYKPSDWEAAIIGYSISGNSTSLPGKSRLEISKYNPTYSDRLNNWTVYLPVTGNQRSMKCRVKIMYIRKGMF